MIKQTSETNLAVIFGVDDDMKIGMDVNLEENLGSFSIREDGKVIGFIFTDPMNAFEAAYYIQQIGKCMLDNANGEEIDKDKYFVPFQEAMGTDEKGNA